MYYLFLLGKLLAEIIPLKISYFIARILASIRFYTSAKDRNSVISNLAILDPKGSKQQLYKKSKEVFINFAYYLVDFFRYAKLNKDFFTQHVRIAGKEYLEEAKARNKGVILLSAHLGNYELGAAIVNSLGCDVYVVALPNKDERIRGFFDRQRELQGIKVIPTGSGVRRSYSALKKGAVVAFLGDRDFSGRKAVFNICSKPAYMPEGFTFFALKTGCAILPVFCLREEGNKFNLVFEKIIEYKENSTPEEIINNYIVILEKYLKKYPQQWYLFQKYWL